MKNIHEGHYAEDPIQVENGSFEGRAWPCACGLTFENRHDIADHLVTERRLARLKKAFNQIWERLTEEPLMLWCMRCHKLSQPSECNDFQCPKCGGNLREVEDAPRSSESIA